MKTNFKMKEATNKEEAIISILDVMKENPLWLNKCTSDLFAIISRIYQVSDKDEPSWEMQTKCDIFNCMPKEQIIKLFIEMKTEYYNFKDNTVWS